MDTDSGQTLIEALQDPALYDHPVRRFRVLETHISRVLLTGDYAYKIKKPVDLGFLDFTTLARRRHFCEEELRLNRRLAPQLYLAVLPITGDVRRPAFAGTGPVIEYAVKMREFPQEAQLDRVLRRGGLKAAHVTALARRVADFHDGAAVAAAADTAFGGPEEVWRPVLQNFQQIRPYLDNARDRGTLDALQVWSERTYQRLADVWVERKRDGFIRECHGDMHLGNIAWVDGEPLIFDCIEFSAALRWIDVISETAFVTMDLHDRGRPDLAHRFLNDYLQQRGDYGGLQVLRFYQVYRALVRAKIACIRLAQPGLAKTGHDEIRARARRYLELARSFTCPVPSPLIITHGLSGSGKTTVSDALVESGGAVRVRSDVERKRLFGLAPEARTGSAVAAGLYSAEAGVRTYERLAGLARTIIIAGLPAIVDAAFLQRAQRARFRALAAELGVPFVIFHCQAAPALLRQRIRQRAAESRDASEADLAVLEHQITTEEPLMSDEADQVFTVDSGTH
jgi:aminoglycoside phosphotransferase family enzyme/predicted kinase